MNLQIRDVPHEIHSVLVRRAARRGMSLRQYAIDVLAAHCSLPTMDEWLDGLDRLSPPPVPVAGADAVRGARDEDDREIASAHHRR